MDADRPPSLAAIVPATDNRATLSRCLAAIRAARQPPEELIAVTDAPGGGPAAARNAGAGRTEADVLVFIDSDVLVHEDVFVRLRRAFGSDRELSAVFGSYDETPEASEVVSSFRNLLHHHVHQTSAGPAATFWCGLGAVRRSVFEVVGGFDEERFSAPSVEDIDLGLRLTALGSVTLLDPEIQGTHLKRWTLAEMVRVDFARRGMPWVALLLRGAGRRASEGASPPPGRILNLSWRHRLSVLASLTAAIALALRRPGAAVVAMLSLIGLNRGFYALLADRLGPAGTMAGIALHVIHHLTALAAAPAGVLLYLRWRRSETGRRDD